jgi:hypothetical protein
LSLETWAELVRDNPRLVELEPDVEALLVNRVKPAFGRSTGEAQEYYLAPIDKCYELVGLIRAYWRGLSGGTEVWTEIEKFFAGLKEQSQYIRI